MESRIRSKETPRRGAMAALAAAESGVVFGPLFFLQHLRGFVRERCPEPQEGLPQVRVRLADGLELDICHIVGVTPKWIALAVYDTERDEESTRMRTDLVPYSMITRLVIRTESERGVHPMGFNADREAPVLGPRAEGALRTPEEALKALARTGTRTKET